MLTESSEETLPEENNLELRKDCPRVVSDFATTAKRQLKHEGLGRKPEA